MTSGFGKALGETFVSQSSHFALTVAEVLDDGTVYATQDGKTFERGVWHTNDLDGVETHSVWAEVWTLGGCQFHGTVDSVSRKVTQVG